MTNQERILRALRLAPEPLDDDELSNRAGVRPRQTVNQVCRRLAADGVIVRLLGRSGKIVNSLVDQAPAPAADPVATLHGESPLRESSERPVATVHPGSSTVQRSAEAVMLAALGADLGIELAPRRLIHPSGARVEVDGADAALTTLVECWAHQGTSKVAQQSKLVKDAVKLHWIADSLDTAPQQLIICVSDAAAIRHLQGRSWQGQAIAALGVEFRVVTLPPDLVATIVETQRRQFR